MLRNKLCQQKGVKSEIFVYIHSEGGDVYAGLSAMDHIRNCDVPVVTIVDGLVASAATFMAIAGKRRLMHKHSQVLIHQLSTGFWGRFQDLLDEVQTCKKLMKVLQKMYNKHATIPEKVLNKLMKKEVYLSSKQCLKYNIIDEII